MADAQTLEEVCTAQRSRVTAALSGRGNQKSRRSAAMRLPPSMRQNTPSPRDAPPISAGTTCTSSEDVEGTDTSSLKHSHARQGQTSVWQQVRWGVRHNVLTIYVTTQHGWRLFGCDRSALLLAVVLCWVDRCLGSWV